MSNRWSVRFFAPGHPATKGSMRSFVANGRTVVKADCARLKAWDALVALAAKQAGATPRTGPVGVLAHWVMPRPKAHYRTGKHSDELRDDAPTAHTKKPDLDKLKRALGDALTGVAYVDDAQICETTLSKRYADHGEVVGCQVCVYQVTGGAR